MSGDPGRQTGQIVGNFSLKNLLGAGGMGEVYLAEHVNQAAFKVAIKLLQPHVSSMTEHVQRFFNEALVVNKIRHAGIVRISDFGYLPSGQAYLIMELLDGESLAARLAKQRLALPKAIEIGRQTASVLESIHGRGFTHRDLKPDNLFLTRDDEMPDGERLKILDFGIAKLTDSTFASQAPLTQAGHMMGTPQYMSPEQWLDSSKVDERSDMYALGCILFEMIAGQTPFVGRSIAEYCQFHLNTPPPRLRSRQADAPAALDELIAAMLEKKPADRPLWIGEIERALSQLGREIEQRRQTGRTPAQKPPPLPSRPAVPTGTPVPAPSAATSVDEYLARAEAMPDNDSRARVLLELARHLDGAREFEKASFVRITAGRALAISAPKAVRTRVANDRTGPKIEPELDHAAAIADPFERARYLRGLAWKLEQGGDRDRALLVRVVAFSTSPHLGDLEILLRLAEATNGWGELPFDAMTKLLESARSTVVTRG